jgi:CRP-like cAMP-binding protein
MTTRVSLLQPLVRRLETHSSLSAAERDAILALPFQQSNHRSCAHLFRTEEPGQRCCVILDGYAARYKVLRDGSRQILNVLMQGDLLGVQRCLFGRADHEVETLTKCTVAVVTAAHLEALLSAHPTLTRILLSDTLYEGAIQREWIVNVGRRDATARIAHLLCEMALRHDQQGLIKRERFSLPLTQAHIADFSGLTSVHVNRVLRALTDERLVSNDNGRITINDWTGLARTGGFDPGYLTPADEAQFRGFN